MNLTLVRFKQGQTKIPPELIAPNRSSSMSGGVAHFEAGEVYAMRIAGDLVIVKHKESGKEAAYPLCDVMHVVPVQEQAQQNGGKR